MQLLPASVRQELQFAYFSLSSGGLQRLPSEWQTQRRNDKNNNGKCITILCISNNHNQMYTIDYQVDINTLIKYFCNNDDLLELFQA